MDNTDLVFQVSTGEVLPVENANVVLYSEENNYYRILVTNESGKTEPVTLTAPDADHSMEPDSDVTPYSRYSARITANGYIPVTINGIQMFEGILSLSMIDLKPIPQDGVYQDTVIDVPGCTLEQEERMVPEAAPSVEPRVLSSVFIPSRITVHLGTPDNFNAPNETVDFPSYIKNVACSEIYPTWPENAIRANVLAQISFTLNRIFTEWYRSRGYNFDITNSTAYDQYYVRGRSIFENVSRIVDEIFNQYIRRRGALNPLFATYCNGTTVTCSGLSQWGTVTLANQGYTPLQILRYYYGNDIEIATATDIRSVTTSYPGYPLSLGSSGNSVRTLQQQLMRIGQNYPAIARISSADGIFGSETASAVRNFQSVFNLAVDGVVGRTTWNKISCVYTQVRRLSELVGESEPLPGLNQYYPQLSYGSRGEYVRLLQYYLRVIAAYYPDIPVVSADGIFGNGTRNSVIAFQRMMGLTADGIVGSGTWEQLENVFLGIARSQGLDVAYPGTPLRVGSRGDSVWLMQSYLNTLSNSYNIPFITADGIFGSNTRAAVIAFQRIAGLAQDGVIGPLTWNEIIAFRLLV